MVKLISLLFCCLVGFVGLVNCEYNPNRMYIVTKAYQKLNDELIDKTNSKEPEENFKAARELYALHRKNKGVDKTQLDADELFLAMSTITDENICSDYTNGILKNVANQKRNDRSDDAYGSSRRVDKIYQIYFDKWAEKCGSSYPAILREKLAKMEKSKLKYLDTFFDEAIDKYVIKVDQWSSGKSEVDKLSDMATGFTYVKDVRSLDYIIRKLREIAQTDPNAKSPEDRTIFEEDEKEGWRLFKESKFKQYYAEPCKYYEDQLGTSVFVPSMLMYRKSKKVLYPNDPDFYRAWAKYKFCTTNNDIVSGNRLFRAVAAGEI